MSSHAPLFIQRLDPTSRPRRRQSLERGVVMVWAAASMLIIAGVVLAGTHEIRALDRITENQYESQGQARAVAHAGVADTVAWFRRQQGQPVRTFAPQREFFVDELIEEGESIINETEDPDIGLVREYEIGRGLWGRYEARKPTPAETFVDTNQNGRYDKGESFDDLNDDGKRTPAYGTRDTSSERGLSGDGACWHIESIGMVYRRTKSEEALGTTANPLVAKYRLSTDIRRLTLSLPAVAGINARTGGLVYVRKKARIRSPQTAVAVGTAAKAVQVSRPAEIIAPIDAVNIPGYKDALYDIFGVEWAELHAMADISITSSPAEINEPIPDNSLVVVTGDLVFDQGYPLEGLAILAVKGDVTITADSNSYFRGVLYVDGHLTIEAPAYVKGSIVTTGWVKLIGSATDLVEVEHDPDLVNDLLRNIGQYRQMKAVYPTAPKLADGRPREAVTTRAAGGVADPSSDNGNGKGKGKGKE